LLPTNFNRAEFKDFQALMPFFPKQTGNSPAHPHGHQDKAKDYTHHTVSRHQFSAVSQKRTSREKPPAEL